jgi:hypothetical protein
MIPMAFDAVFEWIEEVFLGGDGAHVVGTSLVIGRSSYIEI